MVASVLRYVFVLPKQVNVRLSNVCMQLGIIFVYLIRKFFEKTKNQSLSVRRVKTVYARKLFSNSEFPKRLYSSTSKVVLCNLAFAETSSLFHFFSARLVSISIVQLSYSVRGYKVNFQISSERESTKLFSQKFETKLDEASFFAFDYKKTRPRFEAWSGHIHLNMSQICLFSHLGETSI